MIIPARGGSKGVKDKNIRLIDGIPLISYAIQCAKESKKTTRFIVSTDSEIIAEIAKKEGAEIIYRPSYLAQDDTPMVPVLIHACQELEKNNLYFDLIVLLQVTSPIRTGKDVDNVISMFEDEPNLQAVISVVPMDDIHPARMYTVDNQLNMFPFLKKGEEYRRQDLPLVYYRNGCIYSIRKDILFEQKTLMPSYKKAYIMPQEWLANIDNERDIIITEALVREWKKRKI